MHPVPHPSWFRLHSLLPRLRLLTALALTGVALGIGACDSEEPAGPPATPSRDAGSDAGPVGTDAGGQEPDGGPVDPQPDGGQDPLPPAFSLATSSEQTVRFDPTTRTALAVGVLRQPTFSGDVLLTVEGLPAHVSTEPLPVTVSATESGAPVGFYPDEFAAYGRFPLTLVGVGGGERVEFPVTLVVQPGRAALDSAFGTAGVAMPALGLTAVSINAMAAQPDGKWLLVGSTGATGLRDVLVARLLPNGTPDTSFGTQGVVVSDICGSDDYADAVTVQSDGSIVIAGGAIAGTNTCAGTKYQSVLLVRYTSAGGLDTTFGGTGVRTFQLSTGNSTLHAVTLDATGRIVGAGTVRNSDLDLLAVRLLSTGALDTTFSGDGVAAVDLGREDDGLCVVTEPDGKVVVAGTSSGSLNTLALIRFNSNGTWDRTLGYVPSFTSPDITPRTLHRLADGKLLVGGRADFADGATRATLVRVWAGGDEDTSFNGVGFTFLTAGLPGVKDAVVGTGLLSGGAIALATWSQDSKGASALGVIHVSADGASTLRSHRTDLPGDEKPTTALLDAEGFLRVAGTRIPEGQTQATPFVTRFHPY
ncbi:hypothetical protein [Corallococcus llansteffanensis]|uniref:Delta-60 repeat domain-containing protein n=1 Tax=Corallococcus llansteffanensis TaxID=2316731 RepID=A0A3A8PT70_9BACT|nr:hypothetical protein [Corallococcus llansteffanensis]RKH54684.1 hypothetical protein D7V93_25040 [Corallococcus llansteffanensis]